MSESQIDQPRDASPQEAPPSKGTTQISARELLYGRGQKPEFPIEYWEKRLVGKRMIKSDEPGDENACLLNPFTRMIYL